uniref:Uncharacterized protein n=1 Tax=viral metagenome TaxID=1070528 RepID=A0A6M3LQ49_9ZZZZ
MSVIIAGTCKICKKKYWVSLGTPDWYKKWLNDKPKDDPPQISAWKLLRAQNICLDCGLPSWNKFAEVLVDCQQTERGGAKC